MKQAGFEAGTLGSFLGKCVAIGWVLGATCVAIPALAEDADAVNQVVAVAQAEAITKGADFLAIALVVGLSCLAAGYAVAKVGTAAIGLIAEKPEMMGRSLMLVGLAEGIAIYGLIFGILMLQKL